MTTFKIDTATRGGKAWFNRWIIQRMTLFGLFGWFGVTLSSICWLSPWQWSTLFSGGRFAYAFWWSFPLAVVGGYLAVYTQLKLQVQSERKETEQAAAANAKTPEEEAIEQAEYLGKRRTSH